MSDKKFMIFIFCLLAVMAILTVAHVIYIGWAYKHCSIIYFISKELW